MEKAFGKLLGNPGYLFNLEATNTCLNVLPKNNELDILHSIGKIQKQYIQNSIKKLKSKSEIYLQILNNLQSPQKCKFCIPSQTLQIARKIVPNVTNLTPVEIMRAVDEYDFIKNFQLNNLGKNNNEYKITPNNFFNSYIVNNIKKISELHISPFAIAYTLIVGQVKSWTFKVVEKDNHYEGLIEIHLKEIHLKSDSVINIKYRDLHKIVYSLIGNSSNYYKINKDKLSKLELATIPVNPWYWLGQDKELTLEELSQYTLEYCNKHSKTTPYEISVVVLKSSKKEIRIRILDTDEDNPCESIFMMNEKYLSENKGYQLSIYLYKQNVVISKIIKNNLILKPYHSSSFQFKTELIVGKKGTLKLHKRENYLRFEYNPKRKVKIYGKEYYQPYHPKLYSDSNQHVELVRQLDPFQIAVVDRFASTGQKSMLLTHYMGTGKTLTGLCVMYYFATRRIPIRNFIVICPDSITSEWDNEINTWNVDEIYKFDIHIKGYSEVLDWDNLDTNFKSSFPYSFVILDEAHRLTESNEMYGKENISDENNLENRQNIAEKQKKWILLIKEVEKAKRILMLTGTPVYRSAFDLAYLVNILSRNKTGYNIFPESEIEFNSKFMELDKIKKSTRGTLSPLLGTITAGAMIPGLLKLIPDVYNPQLKNNFQTMGLSYFSWSTLIGSAIQMFTSYQYMKIYTEPNASFVWNNLHRENLITSLRPYVDHYNLSDFIETESEFPWKKFKFEFIPYNCKQLIASVALKLSNVSPKELEKYGLMDPRMFDKDYITNNELLQYKTTHMNAIILNPLHIDDETNKSRRNSHQSSSYNKSRRKSSNTNISMRRSSRRFTKSKTMKNSTNSNQSWYSWGLSFMNYFNPASDSFLTKSNGIIGNHMDKIKEIIFSKLQIASSIMPYVKIHTNRSSIYDSNKIVHFANIEIPTEAEAQLIKGSLGVYSSFTGTFKSGMKGYVEFNGKYRKAVIDPDGHIRYKLTTSDEISSIDSLFSSPTSTYLVKTIYSINYKLGLWRRVKDTSRINWYSHDAVEIAIVNKDEIKTCCKVIFGPVHNNIRKHDIQNYLEKHAIYFKSINRIDITQYFNHTEKTLWNFWKNKLQQVDTSFEPCLWEIEFFTLFQTESSLKTSFQVPIRTLTDRDILKNDNLIPSISKSITSLLNNCVFQIRISKESHILQKTIITKYNKKLRGGNQNKPIDKKKRTVIKDNITINIDNQLKKITKNISEIVFKCISENNNLNDINTFVTSKTWDNLSSEFIIGYVLFTSPGLCSSVLAKHISSNINQPLSTKIDYNFEKVGNRLNTNDVLDDNEDQNQKKYLQQIFQESHKKQVINLKNSLRIGNMPVNQIIKNNNTTYESTQYPPKWELMFTNYLQYGDITSSNNGNIICFNKNKKKYESVIPYMRNIQFNYDSYSTKKTFREVRKYPKSVIYSQFSDGVGGIYQFKEFLLKTKNAWFYVPSKEMGGEYKWWHWDDKEKIYKLTFGKDNVPKGVYKFALMDRLIQKINTIKENSKVIVFYEGNDIIGKVIKINKKNQEIISYNVVLYIKQKKETIIKHTNKNYNIGDIISIDNNISNSKIVDIIKDEKDNIKYLVEFEIKNKIIVTIPEHEIRTLYSGNSKIENTNSRNAFNNSEIDLCLIHYSITEGISFKKVRQIHIMEPTESPSQWEQVIARAARNGSHTDIECPEDRYIQIITWICIIPKQFGLIADTQFSIKNVIKGVGLAIPLVGTTFLQFIQGLFGVVDNKHSKHLQSITNSLSNFSFERYVNLQQTKDYQISLRKVAKLWHQTMPQTPFQLTNVGITNSPDFDVLRQCNKQMQAVNGLQIILRDLYQNSGTFYPNKCNHKIRWNSTKCTEESKNKYGNWVSNDESNKIHNVRLENENVYKCMYDGRHVHVSTTEKLPSINIKSVRQYNNSIHEKTKKRKD